MQISIIIPTLNEEARIIHTLKPLQKLRERGHEVIVVDGESSDSTVFLSQPFVDRFLVTRRGRSTQMNTGAQVAKGDVLLFLHADTQLPEGADEAILTGLSRGQRKWGRFNVRLSGHSLWLRVIEWAMNWRSRLTGIATGDQALFMRREVFAMVEGFPEISLMEDIALCRRLKHYGWPLCLALAVTTSSRYWEKHGIVRTVFLMWSLRLAYFLRVNPEHLVKVYYRYYRY